ncbi:arginyltransferase [Thalassomonas sp. M1454]|uniref:arginyltransferase n=1 Tax=Thalassomonas sp. M1454 TaxID=2594477 RepID=UPI0011816675|nr:arginyltransferase [Thalassomonas sp. M1454]TRX56904.1 arginyltransferase [Thalassomonas sp. M1454]
MNDENLYFKFGLTKAFDCNYLAKQKERLIVITNSELLNDENYQRLLASGFRRSGDQVYKPHCEFCNACESIRIPVQEFKPSRSQKRIIANNKDLAIALSNEAKPEYFDLYKRYIDTVHQDGSMYPANKEQYQGFIFSSKISQLFIEVYLEDTLVSVAVCDSLPNALSALYTFYDPTLAKRSLGKFSIIKQIEISQLLNKDTLYLGYQIDECDKMNYKKQYKPHQRLKNDLWVTTNK